MCLVRSFALAAALLLRLVAASTLAAVDPTSEPAACPTAAAARGTCAPARDHSLMQSPSFQVSRIRAHTALAGPSVVDANGFLKVEGNKIVSSKTNQPVRLRGMSFFWSQWMPQFWTGDTVQWLRDDWKATVVRAAMGVEHGGYLENPQVEEARVQTVVDAAIQAGIYVIVDWHDHNADQHRNEARAFFGRMAERYGRQPNVLFEVFNEPVQQAWSGVLKPYHQELVGAIRQHSDNIIILGTRLWSQEVEEASRDPVEGQNLAYTVHFYANTHRQGLRNKVERALANGVAIFATEWGTCDASGDGSLDLGEAQAWLDFFGRHHISDANWAVSDKSESCSALRPGASGHGGWDRGTLTESGSWVRASLRGADDGQGGPPPQGCAGTGEDCRAAGCCRDASLRCFQKNEWWAMCRASCTPGVDPNDPPEHRTPWSCAVLG